MDDADDCGRAPPNFVRRGCLNGSIWDPLARSDHAADGQQSRVVVPVSIFQFWTQYHRLHHHHPPADDPSDRTPNTADEEDARHTTENEGDSR